MPRAQRNAIEKITTEPHFAHFAQGYRLRASADAEEQQDRRGLKDLDQAAVGQRRVSAFTSTP